MTVPLAEGANTITLQETDAAGNVGPISPPLAVTLDTTPPAAISAVLDPASDTGPSGADNNTRNNQPTFVNSIDRAPFLPLIELLLQRGADPNVRMKEVPPIRRDFLRITGSLAWVDFTGQTPFLRAALSADTTTMRLLVEHGADPNLPTLAGTTPLMAAAGVNWVVAQTYTESIPARLDAVKLCLGLGADVNATNSMGLTALLGAVNRGSNDIIELLVARGARLDIKDKEGRTPLRWAEGVFLAAVGEGAALARGCGRSRGGAGGGAV